jgi:hypothetical protein
MEKLTTADIKILEIGIANGKKFQILLMSLAFIAIILLALCMFLKWQFPAPLFTGVFAAFLVVVTIIQHFRNQKVVLDLANGKSTTLEGVIAKKEMKQGANSYNDSYTKESLEELAQYIEDKEKGIAKDPGIAGWNLNQAASSAFNITLVDGSIHTVTLRNFIDLNIQDKVRITLTPLSKTFLGVTKL